MTKKTESKKTSTDADQVNAHMAQVTHLKNEINLLRDIIKGVSPRIQERIKWNAPSYYCGEDMVTFGPIRDDRVLLVFHHPSIEKIKSPLLEGKFKGRRLAYFANKKEINANRDELVRVLSELLKHVSQQPK